MSQLEIHCIQQGGLSPLRKISHTTVAAASYGGDRVVKGYLISPASSVP